MKRHFFFFALLGLVYLLYQSLNQKESLGEFIAIRQSPVAKLSEKRQLLPRPKNSDGKPIASMHSASIVSLGGGRLIAAYFAGSREGAKDVGIYANIFENGKWGESFKMLDKKALQRASGLYIKKLGNPVLVLDNAQGLVRLFVVGVSLGGWATSRIFELRGKPDELKFVRVLSLSPLANLSHLVRSNPIYLKNEGFILPIYFELGYKYPLLLSFKGDEFKILAPNVGAQLQPSLALLLKDKAIISYRNQNHSDLILQDFSPKPPYFSPPKSSNIKNFDSSVASFVYQNRLYLINNIKNEHSHRGILALFEMIKGELKLKKILDESKVGEVSYPNLLLRDGYVHIIYTKNRSHIAYLALPLGSL